MGEVDVLFVNWNRLAMTEVSFAALLANTNWERVRVAYIHDDNSEDGGTEWLREAVKQIPVPYAFHVHPFRSPVAVMKWYADHPGRAPIMAKVDNDAAMPPGWLDVMLDVLAANPDLELLGAEAGMTCVTGRDGCVGPYRAEPCSHIGGIGLIRSEAFERGRIHANGRSGWTEHQHRYDPPRAWVTPDLPVILLDRLPFEPWVSLSDLYVEKGWQRPWGKWSERWMAWAYEWLFPEMAVDL